MDLNESLKKLVFEKSQLKQLVYSNTLQAFKQFHDTTAEIISLFESENQSSSHVVNFKFSDRGDFEFEVQFAGDILVFLMHTNVFEIPRNHDLMRTQYIREDTTRSYCGIIHIYNFLADSFKYQRDNDLGYLIGRIFINKDQHYFIEGKRELGMLYNNFNTSVLNQDAIQSIIESAIEYTTNFDLLTPPFDEIKVIPVGEIRNDLDKKSIITAKRLGFRFQADN
ncbi:MAG: hypothetical protein KBT04_01960 [Bacteroidales bacterium]|nr:hypothetical protein [Candidatus Colimorpha onthohippi]